MSGWTDERAELAKRLYLVDGLSGSQISKKLACGLSRNAVLGKLFRMGVLERHRPSAPTMRRAPASPVRARPKRQVVAPLAPPVVLPGKEQCKWPIGDPALAGFHFCSDRALIGRVYCKAHCRKAYQGFVCA